MKDIKLYIADKYNNDEYEPVEEGIYLCNDEFVISLSFVQEPEFGEEEYASCISQYPLEDILGGKARILGHSIAEMKAFFLHFCIL